jgi:hypothetical protein
VTTLTEEMLIVGYWVLGRFEGETLIVGYWVLGRFAGTGAGAGC